MPAKVLFVDDEPNVLDALRRSLGRRYDVYCATSGIEALSMMESLGPFAVIITDMQMPGMTGLELLRVVRGRSPEMVRLVLSGHADFDAAIAAVTEGAVFRFHTKPVSPDVLCASIESALVRHEAEKHSKGLIDPSQELMRDVDDVRRALKHNEFRLYLQPQFQMSDHQLSGAEALIRWEHPERGLLLPGNFFAAAESAGMFGAITDWMLNSTCKQIAHWNNYYSDIPRIAVNITAMDLADDGFLARVRRTLARHDVNPQFLEFELTESTAVTDLDRSRHTMRELAHMGFEFSVDDFGSGYSSLAWLQQLQINKLKIDRMFIQDVADDPEAHSIVTAVIALAHDLNLQTLAEGVETPEQGNTLLNLGCQLTQGFLFGRPVSTAEFERFWLI